MEKEEKREKRWKDTIKEWTLPAQLGQLKTGQNGKVGWLVVWGLTAL